MLAVAMFQMPTGPKYDSAQSKFTTGLSPTAQTQPSHTQTALMIGEGHLTRSILAFERLINVLFNRITILCRFCIDFCL